jgi:hypothetical protein
VVSLELIPGALVGFPSIPITMLTFEAIAFLKVDVAQVAIGAFLTGICYVAWHAIQ